MSCSFDPDLPVPDAARWLVEAAAPWQQLVSFGPQVFEASARLRFIPDPSRPGQAEADVVLAHDHLPELLQTQRALHHLAAFTATADDCCFCIWDGYSDVVVRSVETEVLVLPHRTYAMFRGPLSRIDSFAADFGLGGTIAPPAFVWPADHSWCFASDVDPHWAGISACPAALDVLMADASLDVVLAAPDELQPRYY